MPKRIMPIRRFKLDPGGQTGSCSRSYPMRSSCPVNSCLAEGYPRSAGRCRGFSLIEVLVAMLVLSVGVLAIVALQIQGLRYNQDSYFRGQVNALAYDLADRIRLNNTQIGLFATNISNTSVGAGTATRTGAGARAVDCDVASLAGEIDCWLNQAAQVLPAGSTPTVANVLNNNNTNTITITIAWTDREGGRRNTIYTFEL